MIEYLNSPVSRSFVTKGSPTPKNCVQILNFTLYIHAYKYFIVILYLKTYIASYIAEAIAAPCMSSNRNDIHIASYIAITAETAKL